MKYEGCLTWIFFCLILVLCNAINKLFSSDILFGLHFFWHYGVFSLHVRHLCYRLQSSNFIRVMYTCNTRLMVTHCAVDLSELPCDSAAILSRRLGTVVVSYPMSLPGTRDHGVFPEYEKKRHPKHTYTETWNYYSFFSVYISWCFPKWIT